MAVYERNDLSDPLLAVILEIGTRLPRDNASDLEYNLNRYTMIFSYNLDRSNCEQVSFTGVQ